MSPPASFLAFLSGQRGRLWLALLAAAWLFTLILSPRLQRRFGVLDNGAWFLDTYAILASCDAVRQGIDPALPNPLDVYRRPHSYSHWWFALGKLGLTRDDNFLLGGTIVALFYAAVLLGLAPRSRGELAWYAALLLSPPVVLAVNRANNDLAVFAILGFGLWLARRPTGARPAWFGGAVLLATGLKFFPLVAAGAPVVLRPARRGLLWAAGVSVAGLLVFASVREDFARAVFPVPIGTHVFGASVFWRNIGILERAPVNLSLALLAAGALWLAMRKRTAGLAEPPPAADAPDTRLAFMTGALLLLACFAAGISYAYRWVFALWLAPWLWQQAWTVAPAAGPRFVARLGWVLLTVAMWMDGAYCFIVNSIMGPMEVSRLIHWEEHWNMSAQPVVWTLMLLLAGWVAEALLAAARELLHRPEPQRTAGRGTSSQSP